MSIGKLTSFANSPFVQKIGSNVDKFCNSIGSKISPAIDKTGSKLDSFIKAVEPTGANNAFIPMTGLMVGTVIVPRVIAAAKRNPDDKEATKDEIFEILFRDIQTVTIILFLLKILNSLIAGKASKLSGLPMTNKPYEQLFNDNTKGLKGIAQKAREFIHAPGEKLKILGKNILDTVHPTDGVRALTNDEFVSRYSKLGSIENIQKLFTEIGDKKGNPEKIFNKIMDILVNEQAALVHKLQGSGLDENFSKANSVLEKLQEVKEMGYAALNSENISKMDEDVKTQLIKFFNNRDNKLVQDAKVLNAALRTGALAIESIYLGFGLPTLYEKILIKKYLGNDSKQNEVTGYGNTSFNPLIDKNLKAQEVKLFSNFVK